MEQVPQSRQIKGEFCSILRNSFPSGESTSSLAFSDFGLMNNAFLSGKPDSAASLGGAMPSRKTPGTAGSCGLAGGARMIRACFARGPTPRPMQ